MQAEEARRVLHQQVDQQANELSSRSQKAAKKRQELASKPAFPLQRVRRKGQELPGALQPQ
eukprot:5744506-Pleurochrysis_carterae.AAC.1